MTTSPTDAIPTVAAAEFRTLMAGFPSGVSVIAARTPEGQPHGMTCSAVCSVTLEPPTLLACLRTGTRTLAAALASGRFTVNLLHEHARATAELFGSGAADRFSRVRWAWAQDGAGPHLVDDAHAVADCRVSTVHQVGSHTVVYGEVLRISQRPQAGPLLYGLREYAAWPVAARR
ncbi:flavin reductase family protein [Kitasatospora kifunensis]|uniref:Flavin reductase (DIM6/NTAB) family NADH-FMN oxidoreductase RutF n=1 Tax=Kitasatospora kifunensis TaxID=58351 RepID=A0A7W7VWF2_KITKI|nr:flavin reductase family protein [Kitasatospora kifunensis]MBB4924913.1 flavin reductase (DIM6/NTAB) family NADH-FMN oxidoreductase RutF [Kitasatospora kifunensis]